MQFQINCDRIKKLFIKQEMTKVKVCKCWQNPTNFLEEVKIMKEGIHPDYYQATVTCNCGNTFVTGSTKEDIHVEIRSTQDSRNLQELTDVSISSTRSTALTNSTQVNMVKDKVEVYLISTFF